jgi:chemotaxis protein CheD
MKAVPRNNQNGPPGPQPAAIKGFEHINRYWDPQNEIYTAKLLPGEYYVTISGEMITTVLGSCISACIRDKVFGVGGMNHFMLPDHAENRNGSWENTKVNAATRYGNYAMEHLINDILKRGGRRENLEVKLFGGGQVLNIATNIGGKNAQFAENYVRTEKLVLSAIDVEGPYPRKVNYYPATGKVRVKRLEALHNETIVRREENYLHSLEIKPIETEIDLF